MGTLIRNMNNNLHAKSQEQIKKEYQEIVSLTYNVEDNKFASHYIAILAKKAYQTFEELKP